MEYIGSIYKWESKAKCQESALAFTDLLTINQIFTNASVCVSAAVGGGLIFTIILIDVIWYLKLLQCFFAEVVIRTLTWKNKGKTFWLMCLRYVSGTWKHLLLGSREKILEINSSDELFKILLHWNFTLWWILIWGFYFQHFFYLFPWIFCPPAEIVQSFHAVPGGFPFADKSLQKLRPHLRLPAVSPAL